MPTSAETFRAMIDGGCRLNNGDRSQVDTLAGFYAEVTDVRHPTARRVHLPRRRRRDRAGVIVESRDYIDHVGLARATGTIDALCARLTDR